MKRLLMTMLLGAFCWTASAMDGPQQDTTKNRQDTTKKHMKKKSPADKKNKKKDWSKKQDSLKKNPRKIDTITPPPQNP